MRRLLVKHPDGLAGFDGDLTPTVAEKLEQDISAVTLGLEKSTIRVTEVSLLDEQ